MSDDWAVVEEALAYASSWAPPDHEVDPDVTAALARLREREAQLERENELADAVYRYTVQQRDKAWQRAEAAEARVARLEEALREIADATNVLTNEGMTTNSATVMGAALGNARRALAHEEEITGDGSGHALPPLIEGYSPKRSDQVAHEEEA